MSYHPDFDDPRVRRRVKNALGWTCANLGYRKEPKFLTRDHINSVYGNGSNPLSKWLRQKLLTTNHRYNHATNTAKTYQLNTAGVKYCRRQLRQPRGAKSLIKTVAIEWAQQKHGSEIASGKFEYNDKNNRYWNSLQHYPTVIRDPLFASYGYIHAYDIESAAPTILLQYSRLMGLEKSTPVIDDYLNNKTLRRAQLASRLHTDVTTAKRVITALFNGATYRPTGDIATKVLPNRLAFARLVNDEWCEQLRVDIRKMWVPLDAKNAQQKSAVYRKEERRVMSAVIKYLKRERHISNRPVRYFLEHDGWRSDCPVDLYVLSLFVKNSTGYNIKFSEEVIQ